MECRATVAQRRRVPGKAEECVRVATRGVRVVDANGRVPNPRAASGDSTLAQACIYGVAEARWSILAGALVRLGRLLIP